ESDLRSAIKSLTGTISQVPPAYSAKSVDGTRAYDAARRGTPLDIPAVDVTVHNWDLRELSAEMVSAVITCSGGTYIRALARDVGRLTASAAHLAALRRTRIGEFDVRDAATLETLSAELVRVRPLRVVADA
ncbi:MAG: tRNA pseudouridine55 synthase, partial [Gemmatimonadaceae bacterium]|nr:tRNA pseudouridine55 synthase [Gemmatimonadaceae bacterium]